MEEFISKTVEIAMISFYVDENYFTYRVLFWNIIAFMIQISVHFMKPEKDQKDIKKKDVFCLVLFSLSIVCGMIFSFQISYFWTFSLIFLITTVLILIRHSPPFMMEKKGAGGIFRILLEGWFWIILHSLAITDSPRFIVIEYLPVFFVYEAWYLVKEIDNSPSDLSNKHVTTAILMGRHGFFRLFFLLNIFSWIYLVLDMNFSYTLGLPLLLQPWSLLLISRAKSFDTKRVKNQAFFYYLSFCLLTATGLTYK